MKDVPPNPAPARRSAWKRALPWLVAGAVLAGLWVFDGRTGIRTVLEAIERLGPWGPLIFVAAYVLATVLFVPGSALTLAAGTMFGVGWGCVYVSAGSTLGAMAAFLVGRHLARDWVARRISANARFQAIDRAVADQGWKIVLLTRLSPVFPFTLLNYAFGLTQVRFRDYAIASWIGMMPGTVLYVYLGSLARAGASTTQRTPGQWALYGLGLAATLAVTLLLTRIARRSLARHTAPSEAPAA